MKCLVLLSIGLSLYANTANALDTKANQGFFNLLALRDQMRTELAKAKQSEDVQKIANLYTAKMTGSILRPISLTIKQQQDLSDQVFEIKTIQLVSVRYAEDISDFTVRLDLSIEAKTLLSKETRLAEGDLGIVFTQDDKDYTMHHIYFLDADRNPVFMTDFLGLEQDQIDKGFRGRLTLYKVPIMDLLTTDIITAY